jgi:hypothetical protein
MVKLILYINVLYDILLAVEENETLDNVLEVIIFTNLPLKLKRPPRDLKIRMLWLLCFIFLLRCVTIFFFAFQRKNTYL